MKANEALTYKEALENYDILDEFLKNKIKYLESEDQKHLTEISKNVMWTKFRNEIHMFEFMWDKDLALFKEDNVRMILSSVKGGTYSPAKTLFSIINKYEVWALKVGLNPASNPCDTIDVKEIAVPVQTIMDNTIISIDELFESWDYIQTYSNEYSDRVTYQSFAMILLMRVGLKGVKQWNELLYLKEEDIDFENGLIHVTNRDKDVVDGKKQLEIVKTIAIDESVVNIIKKAIEETEYEYEFNAGRKSAAVMKKSNVYVDYGYVIKPEEGQGEFINSTVFRKRIENFFKAADRKYINAKDIFRNAKLDMLLSIKEQKGKLSIQDFKDVQDFYEPYLSSSTAFMNLKEFYQCYTGDEDIIGTRDMSNFKDEEKRKDARKKFLKEYYLNITKNKRGKKD